MQAAFSRVANLLFSRISNKFDVGSRDWNSIKVLPDAAVMERKKGQYCWDCGETIRDQYLLYAVDRYWHTGCLKCSVCRILLADAGTSCYTRSGLILCRDDYLRLFGREGECHACHETIPATEMVMKIQGLAYHLRCFICSRCHGPLSLGDKYQLWEGRLLCDRECLRLFRRSIGLTPQRRSAAPKTPRMAKT